MQNHHIHIHLPPQILDTMINAQINRVKSPIRKIVLYGILAGVFIALGATASNVAMHDISNVGLARIIGGIVFPIGLMMIIFIGGKLFTGDCLLILGVLDKRYKVSAMLRVLILVYIFNLLGCLIIAVLANFSGQFDYSNGLLGAFTIHLAIGKTSMSFAKALCSGILCNIFVCGAVLMSTAAKDAAGKVLAIFFPIFAFVVSGYEHCIANMYYIPAGIFASHNQDYVNIAIERYGYTAEQLAGLNWKSFFIGNLLPVTIGNIIGGMFFVGVSLYFANKKKEEKTEE